MSFELRALSTKREPLPTTDNEGALSSKDRGERSLPSTQYSVRSTSYTNIVWAPSMSSMKSETFRTPSRPSIMPSSVSENMSTDILQAQR